jgi:UDP-N-acetylglucosamine acyltransferase
VGNHTIFANNAQLAGHVQVGDWAILGGHSGVHQFCKIGAHAMLGMFTSLTQDVPPFVILSGNPAAPHGVNVEGLRRRGFSREEIDAIRNAYRLIYKSGLTLDEAKLAIANEAQSQPAVSAYLNTLLEFLESVTRGIVR